MFRTFLAATACAAALAVLAPTAFADDLPAVSGLNGKLELGGGGIDHKGIGYAEGSLSVPLGHRFGLQVDALGGEWNGKAIEGGAGHLFARNPNLGLIGLYGSYVNTNVPQLNITNYNFDTDTITHSQSGNSYIARFGPEAAIYINRWSLDARFGAETGSIGHHLAYDRAALGYYPIDNLRLSVGQRYTLNTNLGFAEVEYLLPVPVVNVSFFAHVEGSSEHDTAAFGGLRFYFGQKKTLIRRHREDDPDASLPEDLFDISHGTKSQTVCHYEGNIVPCEI